MNLLKLQKGASLLKRELVAPNSAPMMARIITKGKLVIRGRIPSSSGKGDEHMAYLAFKAVAHEDAPGRAAVVKNRETGKAVKVVCPTLKARCQVRCTCSDYTYTWYDSNRAQDADYGKKLARPTGPSKGGAPRNPKKIPGLCKHLAATVKSAKRKEWIV